MKCRNCQQTLSQEDSYCRDCGAKLVQERLTMKYFWTEIRDGFLNIDSNRPMLTFLHLFTKPEVVIEGYIKGTRKKYINAFGYFTIAITFSSFFYFVIKRLLPEVMEALYNMQRNDAVEAEFMKTVMDTIYEYQTFLFFLMIPIFALLSWVVFYNRRRHNYAEHLVINLYAYSHASIISVMLYFLTIWNVELFTYASMSALVIQLVYYMYVLKRLYQLSPKQLILKTFYFIVLLFPVYIFMVLLFMIILFAMGGFEQFIELQRAKNEVTYIASSVMNWTS